MSTRPEIFDKDAVIESLSAFALSQKVAKDTTSAMSFLFPMVIDGLGTDKLIEMVELKLRALGYSENTIEVWKTNRLPYIVKWAQHEMKQFEKSRLG